MNKNGNIIIVFEGPDGSGKTTQCTKMLEYLKKKGIKTFYVKARVKSDKVYKMICEIEEMNNKNKNEFPKWLKSSLIAYERSKQLYDFFDSVNDAVILVDKYIYSTEIYLKYKKIQSKYPEMLLRWLPEPDMLIYFEVNEEICMDRIIRRGERIGVNENIEFLSILNKKMKNKILDSVHNVVSIDASKNIEEIFCNIKTYINNLLEENYLREEGKK